MTGTIERVGRTAFIIAQWRADETESLAPLYYDHLAGLFLDEEARKLAAGIEAASPATKFLVQHRVKFFDDALQARLASGCRQVVLLGAGLDTRPLRMGASGVQFFEVDREEVLDFKRARLEKFGYTPASLHVPLDYTARDWVEALARAGLDTGEDTFVLWEGNSMYLERAAVSGTLRALRQGLTRFAISFDYLSARLVRTESGARKSDALLGGFASAGAPWVSGFDNAGEVAREAGLVVSQDMPLADFIERCDPAAPLDKGLLGDYFVCTLETECPR